MKKFINNSRITYLLGILIFLVAWQLSIQFEVMWPLMFANLPSPIDVFNTFLSLCQDANYYNHILASLLRVLLGVFIALIIALPLAMIFMYFTSFEKLLFPTLELFRPIPLIAMVPIVSLLFPSIEYSILSITFIAAFFPLFITIRSSLSLVTGKYKKLAISMKATNIQTLRFIFLPAILPNILSGLSISVGTAWMGVITAEMMSGSKGIGYFTYYSYTMLMHAETIAGTITVSLLGMTCITFIRLLSIYMLKNREEVIQC